MDVEDDLDAFLTKEDILGYYMEVNGLFKGSSCDRLESGYQVLFIFLAFDRW